MKDRIQLFTPIVGVEISCTSTSTHMNTKQTKRNHNTLQHHVKREWKRSYPSSPRHIIHPFSTITTTTSSTTANRKNHNHRKDPTAKRPNRVCDPYGQNGQPMTKQEALNQLTILDPGWTLIYQDREPNKEGNTNDNNESNETEIVHVPKYLQKEFHHLNYIDGSKFASVLAAVAHNNNHYPTIQLERRLLPKEKAWTVVTIITCHTTVLNGLSFHDFHIAMLMDVEVARKDVNDLIVEDVIDSYKKHT